MHAEVTRTTAELSVVVPETGLRDGREELHGGGGVSEWVLAVLIPVALVAVGLCAFLVWAHLGTKRPLRHDNPMPETHFREQDH
ncbi:hypothetical protein P8605_16375 [Streptomyces sp. T-3]|nr:hypothetical protein [Streptomyces sp. T-3]